MITNLRMELFEALVLTQSHHLPSPPPILPSLPRHSLHPDCAPRSVPAAGADPTVSKFSCCCVLVAWCRKEWVVVLLSLVRRLTVPHQAKSITDISCCWAADGRSSAAAPPPPPGPVTIAHTARPRRLSGSPALTGPVSRSKCWHRDISENNM